MLRVVPLGGPGLTAVGDGKVTELVLETKSVV